MKWATKLKVFLGVGALGATVGGVLAVSGAFDRSLDNVADAIDELLEDGQGPQVIRPGIDEEGRAPPPIMEEPEGGPTGRPAANTGFDYNCNLPGKGFPWLERDEQLDTGERQLVFKSKVGPAIWLGLPVEQSPSGGFNYAEVYEMLCKVHPDLGGSGVHPLTPDERSVLDDTAGIDPFQCVCPYVPVVCALNMPACTSTQNPDYQPPPPRESTPSRWEDFYTDDGPRAPNEPMGLYWLPPIPQDLADTLANEREGEEQTERYAVRLFGVEVIDLGEPGLTGHLQVGFSYNMEFELTVEWTIDEIVGAVAVPTRSTYSVQALGIEAASGPGLKTLPATCLACEDLDNPKLNAIWKPEAEFSVWLDWGDLEPTARVQLTDGPLDVGSVWFFRQAEGVAVTLKEGRGEYVPWLIDDGGIPTTGKLRYEVYLLP